MHERLDAAVRIEHAIVRGDLPQAQAEARLMAGLEYPAAGSPWLAAVDDTAQAAGRIASAGTLVDAAYALGAMGRSCGACHERTPEPTMLPPAPAAPKMMGTMIGHAWAAERMWEGLIGPELERWVEGALRLRADPPARPPEEAAAIAAELASAALSASNDDERAHVFGALLATCAACHQVTRDKHAAP